MSSRAIRRTWVVLGFVLLVLAAMFVLRKASNPDVPPEHVDKDVRQFRPQRNSAGGYRSTTREAKQEERGVEQLIAEDGPEVNALPTRPKAQSDSSEIGWAIEESFLSFLDESVENLGLDTLADDILEDKVPKDVNWEAAIRQLGDPEKGDLLQLMKKIKVMIDTAKSSGDESEKNLLFDMLVDHVKWDEHPEVRRGCVCCLSVFGKNAEEVLKFVMHSDENRGVRMIAAGVMGQVGGEEALDALYLAVQNDKGISGKGRNIASAAVSSIGEIGGPRAAEILIKVWKVWQEKLYPSEGTLSSIGVAGEPSALPLIESVLNGEQEMLRDNAVYALGEIASRNREDHSLLNRIRRILRNCLTDKNPKVRTNAVYSLSLVGESRDVSVLKQLVEDDYKVVVNYVEDGQEKEKEVYPVREEAKRGIKRIQARLDR
jgi:HEAT repeat protein